MITLNEQGNLHFENEDLHMSSENYEKMAMAWFELTNHLVQSCISYPRISGIIQNGNYMKPLYFRRMTSNVDKTFKHVLEVTQHILLMIAKTKVLQQRCLRHIIVLKSFVACQWTMIYLDKFNKTTQYSNKTNLQHT